jgi:hypothetical protein
MLPDPDLTEPQSVRKEYGLPVFLKSDCPRFLTAVYRLEKKTQIHAPLTHPHSNSEMRTGECLNPCEASARGSD